jgi:hypothetical protein
MHSLCINSSTHKMHSLSFFSILTIIAFFLLVQVDGDDTEPPTYYVDNSCMEKDEFYYLYSDFNSLVENTLESLNDYYSTSYHTDVQRVFPVPQSDPAWKLLGGTSSTFVMNHANTLKPHSGC